MAQEMGARRHSLGSVAGAILDIAWVDDTGVIVTPIPSTTATVNFWVW